MVKRFEVYWINMSPSIGSEINKVRPAVIISPPSINNNLKTVIIAPLTSTIKNYPSRVKLYFQERDCSIALDQLRCVDKRRLRERMGKIKLSATHTEICNTLTEIFKK